MKTSTNRNFPYKFELCSFPALLVTSPGCLGFLPKGKEMTVSRVAGDTLFELSCCREQKYISSRPGRSRSERLQNAPNQSSAINELLQKHQATALLTDQIICWWLLTLLGLILLHKKIPP